MMRRLSMLVFAAMVLMIGAAPVHAQDPLARLVGQTVAAVEVRIEDRPETSPALLALVDIKPGDRFAIDTMRRVADRFSQVPRFEDVRVLFEERPGGILLIFNLVPRHPVNQFEFRDDTGLSPAELDRLVREHFGGLPALSRLADVEDAVTRILHNEGFRSARVTTEIVQFHEPDRATLVVHVSAGPRTTIGSIEIAGRSPLSRADVLSRLRISPGQPFRERELAAGLAAIRDELRARGFFTAIAQPPVPPADPGPTVDLVLTIEAGPLVRLEIEGDRLPGSVDDFIPIKAQGSVDQDLLDDARLFTERALRRQGYWRARVSYRRASPDAETLVITFTIERGRRYRLVRVEVPAGLQIGPKEWQAQEALRPGAIFSEDAVNRALLALRAFYQQRGYHLAVMDPKFDEVPGRNAQEGGVVVTPNIVEGPRATMSRIVFDLGERPVIGEAQVRAMMNARERAPYVPANLVYDTNAIRALYEAEGFLNHAVDLRVDLNAEGTDAVLTVFAREGARVVVGEITVVGTERFSPDLILQEITLRRGEPYSDAARVESQRRLNNLGSFRSVRVSAEPRLPGETETRIIISVEEASTITLGYGGGIEVASAPRATEGGGSEDRLEVSPRAFIDVGRRNLGGRNRAVNLFARMSLKPRRAPEDPTRDGEGFGFTEYRVTGTYRERYAFGTETDLLLALTSEQTVRTTFSYLRRSATADLLRPITPRLTASARYSLEFTRLFDERLDEDEQSLIDRLFPQVRLSIFSGALFWDRRDDQISPSRGSQASGNFDLAPRQLGSEVGFVKGFAQASYFRPVVAPRRVILAVRGQLGLARGFERQVPVVDDSDQPVLGPGGEPLVETVADLPASQRFFAGGSTTVRGFQLDRLGVREILNDNGLSDGGNALVVLNAELRVAAGRLFRRSLTVVGFTDAGNVFDRVGDLDLGRLRATAGVGVRYDSPLGPVRLDVGFKLDRFTFPNTRERRWEFHLSIGEVF